MAPAPKQIEKQGLSEYFLYTIEGTETIPNGWSKRMISFDTQAVPVMNLYKYEEERYSDAVVRFLSFTNDQDHELGDTPIPGGLLKVYRSVDSVEHLSYEGQSEFKYIPVGEEVKLNLGQAADVKVEPTLMDRKAENFRFDRNRNVAGFDEVLTYRVAVTNTREVPTEVEIKRNFDTTYWTLTHGDLSGTYSKVDSDTVKFVLTLQPRSDTTFEYTVRLYRGTRQEDWRDN